MSKIFREYIGVKPFSTNLRDFPVQIIKTNISEFHFILGFATEEYDAQNRGTGVFKETWNTRAFGPEAVRNLKGNNPNVKVVISIGGHDAVKTPFNPVEETIWITRAVASLKVIIQKYKDQTGNIIDGIDINYLNVFHTTGDTGHLRFARCIGQVITQLKNDNYLRIKIVSIAPSETNEIHYRNLYWQNEANINWVNYQFYNQSKPVSTLDDFLKLYDQVSRNYKPSVVLPGVSTDKLHIEPVDKMPREHFIAGCRHLLQIASLPGIFLWNADDSTIPLPNENKPFVLEDILQSLLIS